MGMILSCGSRGWDTEQGHSMSTELHAGTGYSLVTPEMLKIKQGGFYFPHSDELFSIQLWSLQFR